MLDFLFIPVAVRVHDGVASEAIADGFKEAGFMLIASKLRRFAHRIADGQNIVAIDAPALHVIGARFAVKFAHGRPLFDTKTHAIQIIYHKIDDGQVIDPARLSDSWKVPALVVPSPI